MNVHMLDIKVGDFVYLFLVYANCSTIIFFVIFSVELIDVLVIKHSFSVSNINYCTFVVHYYVNQINFNDVV